MRGVRLTTPIMSDAEVKVELRDTCAPLVLLHSVCRGSSTFTFSKRQEGQSMKLPGFYFQSRQLRVMMIMTFVTQKGKHKRNSTCV